jgi:sigma-E factor negative regulatory protein RseA
MNERKFESVSAFVDRELAGREVVDELLADKDLAESWSNYHLIGDVMRGEAPEVINLDLADKVMAALDDDVTVLAPKTAAQETGFTGKVVQFFKPIGQVAIAASAAGLMIIGVQQMNVANNDPVMQNNVVQTTHFGGVAEPVSLNVSKEQELKQRQSQLEQQRRIQALLTDHNQQVKFHATRPDVEQQEKAEQTDDIK